MGMMVTLFCPVINLFPLRYRTAVAKLGLQEVHVVFPVFVKFSLPFCLPVLRQTSGWWSGSLLLNRRQASKACRGSLYRLYSLYSLYSLRGKRWGYRT